MGVKLYATQTVCRRTGGDINRLLALAWPALLCSGLAVAGGCASTEYASIREVPRNPLAAPLRLMSRSGPEATERTRQFLRRADLSGVEAADPREMLSAVQQRVSEEPTAQGMYAVSELTYIEGVKAKQDQNEALALDMFGASVAHAYMYLLDERFDGERNPYDPQYRRACDLYNSSLEETLRIMTGHGRLRPGVAHRVNTGRGHFDVEIVVRGRWQTEQIDRFLFTSDYEVNGLTNHYHTYGLGVPLIAVRKTAATEAPDEKFYPPGVTFPMTAFLRVNNDCEAAANRRAAGDEQTVCHCVLELFDPLEATDVAAQHRRVPLESDLSVPLAYFLNQPAFRGARSIANLGFLNPGAGRKIQGLYMLEPYDPQKIPVLLVHGLMSSPVTWTDMYNDLRSDPQIGGRYQFWFYFYPTGQPFWVSAAQMRVDLAEALLTLDPQRQAPALDQMVLVGHSMGGLLSKLQTIDSRDDFWHLVSDQPATNLQGSPDAQTALLSTLYFRPNRSIRRVVTLGTPHRGSHFSNSLTRYATRLVTELPNMLVNTRQQLVRQNPGLFVDEQLLRIDTGVDSLTPDSPFLPAMLRAPQAPWVEYHNVVGLVEEDTFLARLAGRVAGEGDGVVDLASARVENAVSEVIVPAHHTDVHRHPRAVREVQRILRKHAAEFDADRRHWLAAHGGRPPRPSGPRRPYRLQDHYRPATEELPAADNFHPIARLQSEAANRPMRQNLGDSPLSDPFGDGALGVPAGGDAVAPRLSR